MTLCARRGSHILHGWGTVCLYCFRYNISKEVERFDIGLNFHNATYPGETLLETHLLHSEQSESDSHWDWEILCLVERIGGCAKGLKVVIRGKILFWICLSTSHCPHLVMVFLGRVIQGWNYFWFQRFCVLCFDICTPSLFSPSPLLECKFQNKTCTEPLTQ